MGKVFKIKSDQIKQLVDSPIGKGGCLATDYIVCEGFRVGYMYREEADSKEDTGWRFFSGEEDQDYIDDLSHTGVYSVNTIANYDPEIIPFLDAPYGSAFERDLNTGEFLETT